MSKYGIGGTYSHYFYYILKKFLQKRGFILKIYRLILAAGAIAVLLGCASKEIVKPAPNEPPPPPPRPSVPVSQDLEMYACPEANLRGTGLAGDYERALENAVNQIAVQIQSTVTATSKLKVNSDVATDGMESISSSFQKESRVTATIKNRQDVHVLQTVARDGVVGVVACMDRNDAAKPFRVEYQEARDALVSIIAVISMVTHPLEKFENYDKMVAAYARYKESSHILQSLGFNDDEGEIEENYRKAQEAYVDFKSRYKIYMDGAIETDEGRVIFGQISKDMKIQSLEESCEEGLILELETATPKCKEGGFGVSCTEMVALYGKSCTGETYFTLGGTLKGIGRMDEAEAIANLLKNTVKNDFVTKWKKEIERWKAR